MILITDGGSTKCDWIVLDSTGEKVGEKIRTKGLNPAILTEKKLKKILNKNEDLMRIKDDVTHIYFYGAGCGTEKPKNMLKHVLQFLFLNAHVEVEEDTMAAVRACINSEDEAAVVCILGTGSNCSYYDGNQLHQRVKSLGYSIMDDASGNSYGRQLLRDYYFNVMPETIKFAFDHKYNLDADFIKYNLYKQPNPNAYLAGFAEFMFLNKESVYIQNLIKNGFRTFVKSMILQFEEELKGGIPVHFAGSIAYFSSNEIKEVAEEYGFNVGNFNRRPIDGLVAYHSRHL